MVDVSYTNIDFSKEAVEEYNAFQAQFTHVDELRDKKVEELRKRSEQSYKKAKRPLNKAIAFILRNNINENRGYTLNNRAEWLEGQNSKNAADYFGIELPNHVELSKEAKLYAIAAYYENHVKENKIPQIQIDAVMSAARDNINNHPLSINSIENTIPNYQKHDSRIYCSNPLWDENCWRVDLANANIYNIHIKNQKEPVKDIKHSSLTKFFKKDKRDNYNEIIGVIKRCNISRDAGCLPPEWIALIPKEELATKTKEVSKAFQDFAKETYSRHDVPKHCLNEGIENLEAKLRNIISDDIKIGFLGNGAIGKAYKIHMGDEDKALVIKTNHVNPMYTSKNSNHGATKETASGINVSSSSDRKKFAKTYMGRVGEITDKDTFTLTRFIKQVEPEAEKNNTLKHEIERFFKSKDNSNSKKSKTKPDIKYQQKIIDTSRVYNADDHDGNKVDGINIDMGGVYVRDDLVDKQTHKITRMLTQALARRDGVKIVDSIKKTCENNKGLKGKYETAIKYIDKRLKSSLPDISYDGIKTQPLRPEVMTTLGVSNQVELADAFLYAGDNYDMCKYVVESRGGINKVAEEIKSWKGEYRFIHIEAAGYLVKNGMKAEDFKEMYAYNPDKYEELKLFEKKAKKEKLSMKEKLRYAQAIPPKEIVREAKVEIKDNIKQLRDAIKGRK